MSLKWPVKDPDETLDYSIDWSRFLGTNTISAARWFVYDENDAKIPVNQNQTVNGLTSGPQVFSNTVTTIILSNGTLNNTYRIACSITFGNSLVSERTITLQIREL